MQIDHEMTLEDRHNINPANSTSINQGDYYELYTLMELHLMSLSSYWARNLL